MNGFFSSRVLSSWLCSYRGSFYKASLAHIAQNPVVLLVAPGWTPHLLPGLQNPGRSGRPFPSPLLLSRSLGSGAAPVLHLPGPCPDYPCTASSSELNEALLRGRGPLRWSQMSSRCLEHLDLQDWGPRGSKNPHGWDGRPLSFEEAAAPRLNRWLRTVTQWTVIQPSAVICMKPGWQHTYNRSEDLRIKKYGVISAGL